MEQGMKEGQVLLWNEVGIREVAVSSVEELRETRRDIHKFQR